jgi:hypothetical protein
VAQAVGSGGVDEPTEFPGTYGYGSGSGAEGSTPMSPSLIAQFKCFFAQPRSRGVVSLDRLLRYTHRHETAVEEPGNAAEPFAERSSESHTAAVRGAVAAGKASHETPARD